MDGIDGGLGTQCTRLNQGSRGYAVWQVAADERVSASWPDDKGGESPCSVVAFVHSKGETTPGRRELEFVVGAPNDGWAIDVVADYDAFVRTEPNWKRKAVSFDTSLTQFETDQSHYSCRCSFSSQHEPDPARILYYFSPNETYPCR